MATTKEHLELQMERWSLISLGIEKVAFSQTLFSYKQVSSQLEQKIIALYAIGTSNTDIVEFVEETYGIEISEGFISKVTNAISALAQEWQNRPLEQIYPIIYLDAIHIKTRQDQRVINKAVHIVMAYDLNGNKEILGQYISGGSEGAKYWLGVVTDLKNRGVADILIACVDGLAGFDKAINLSISPDDHPTLCGTRHQK